MLTPHWGQEGWPGSKDPVEARYEACYNEPIIDGPWMSREMIARRREVLVLDAVEDLVQFLRGLREERKAVITISATIRDDADGTRWRRVEITLAPLAPGEYIVETTSGAERTLAAFRVVP